MSIPRLEVNLRRLLAKCELLCKTRKTDERLPDYVETLENMLSDVKKLPKASDKITEYEERILQLKVELGLCTEQEDNKRTKLTAREELFGVRQRNPETLKTEDFDELLNFHENMQGKIADDMLTLTRNLKEQSQLANKIIKQDTEIVSRSSQLSDQNFGKLKTESDKLSEHSKRAWKCWMWLMLLIVLVVFINMVLFMKVVKKNN